MRRATMVGFLGVALAGAAAGAANTAVVDQPVTFTKDVLPILQQSCQTCHRPGGDNYTGMVAPMSLVSYDEVRPWAKSIARNVEARIMPPWKADPKYHGVFANERTLTDQQIDTIVQWTRAGAPEGDPAAAPPPRQFPDHVWRIGEPDLIVDAPRYFVGDDVDTLYLNHVVELTEELLPDSRFVQAIEWRGGSSVVHHIVGYALPAATGDNRGQAYGLGSIAPGEEPMHFPEGYAKLLAKGSRVVFSMHYHKEKGAGTGMWDQSQVAFKFFPKDAEIRHFVEHNAIGSATFEIPPGHPNWKIGSARVFAEDTNLIAVHPHMHLRGKDARYVAFYPDGTTEELLSVPAWDFNWQTDYSFRVPKRLPAGTRLEYIAHFDNSAANPANPNPNIPMVNGPNTTDEMMLGYITYAAAEPRSLTVEQVVREHFGAGATVDQESTEDVDAHTSTDAQE